MQASHVGRAQRGGHNMLRNSVVASRVNSNSPLSTSALREVCALLWRQVPPAYRFPVQRGVIPIEGSTT